jgi:hypothetical protein
VLRGLALKKMRAAKPKSRPGLLHSKVPRQCAWFSIFRRYDLDPWGTPDWLDSIQGEMDGLTGLRKKTGEEPRETESRGPTGCFYLIAFGAGENSQRDEPGSSGQLFRAGMSMQPLHTADPSCTQKIPLHRGAQGDTSAQALIAPLPLL